MKQAGVDLVAACLDLNGMKTLAQELQRQGIKDKVTLYHPNSYDQGFVKSAGQLFEGDYVLASFRPFEADAGSSTLAQYQKWMKKAGRTLTEPAMVGWIDADLAYQGIKAAGASVRPAEGRGRHEQDDGLHGGRVAGPDRLVSRARARHRGRPGHPRPGPGLPVAGQGARRRLQGRGRPGQAVGVLAGRHTGVVDTGRHELQVASGSTAMVVATSVGADLFRALLQGTPPGTVYALVALGFVLTYKTSGVFNLAFGAQAYVSAAMYFKAKVEWGWGDRARRSRCRWSCSPPPSAWCSSG